MSRNTLSSLRFFTNIGLFGLMLALAWPSNPTMAQDTDSQSNFGERKRREYRGQTLKLTRKKPRVKLQFKLKRKKTARELEEERLKKLAEEAQRNQQKKAVRKELTAEDVATEKQAKLRLEKIELFKQSIPNLEGPQKAEMLYRLAEEYWEHSKYLRFKAMKKHNTVMEEWDQQCRKIGDVKKCPPAPKPEVEQADAYRSQAVNVYKRVLNEFPNYDRAPEITFILALNLMETGEEAESVKLFQQLIKRWPNNRFIPDTYQTLGDYFFNKNKVNDAIQNYKAAVKVSRQIYMNAESPAERKILTRGIHLRSLYYLAWCDFNVGEYERALKRFKRVIELSTRYSKTKESRVLLKSEALRDLILTFSKMDATLDAYTYFRSVMGPKFAYNATSRLARRYYQQGNYVRAITTFRHLMSINEAGEKDDNGPDTPLLQNEIVRSATRIWEPEKIYGEVIKLTNYFEDSHRWTQTWRDKKKIYDESKERAEQTLLEFSTKYHQSAQTEKNKARQEQFYDFAAKLYEQYLRYFPETESAYELRFFWAELMYRKATIIKGRSTTTPKEATQYFSRAARQYNIVARKPRGQYRKQAAFSEVLCLENLANRTGSAELRGAGKKLEGLKKDPKTGKVTWKRNPIEKGSWDARLLEAYERYLDVVKHDKEERLQTYFKTGTIYYSYKHYLKAMKIFSNMAREFPDNELSRRAAFMILYSYEDLNQWKELESNARLFLEDKTLTINVKFKQEMFEMLIRSAFLTIDVNQKEKNLPKLDVAQLYEQYEKEFGKEGPWTTKKGFKISPASDKSLGLAGVNYTEAKRILKAIQVRERLVNLYTDSPFRDQIKFELGNHFEQIANYDIAARWYERYVFDDKDYMKLAETPTEESSPKAKRSRTKRRPAPKKRPNRAQSRRKGKTASKEEKAATVDPKKVEKQKNDALYKAAAYRRGLEQFDQAIVLYRHYIKKYKGQDKDVPKLYLAIANIHEERKHWDNALATYNEYLDEYQPKSVTEYLEKALRLQKKHLDESGVFTLHVKEKAASARKGKPDPTVAIRKRLGNLQKKDVSDGQLVFVHAQIANIYRTTNKPDLMEDRYMMVDALGYQMYELRVDDMSGLSPTRESYARAKFFLAERRRRDFVKLAFVGHSTKDRTMLKKIINGGKLLARDYTEVANLQYPDWVLAAVFRIGEIYHEFAKKIYAAPMPKNLPQSLWPQYKMAIEGYAARFEEIAIDSYDGVLKQSAAIGLYNEWVRACEDKRNEINRKEGSVNPHTVLSQRKQLFWLVEPTPADVNIPLKSAPVQKPTPATEEPPKRPASPADTKDPASKAKVSQNSPSATKE